MPLDSDRCPPDPDEVAEAYVMGTLTEADAVAFEDHYITCAACASVVEVNQQFVQAMRDAGRDCRPNRRG